MKLRAKYTSEDFPTGEVMEASICVTVDPKTGGTHTTWYDSIKELLEDWEDADEI